jgi:hypothetical protein
MNVAGQAHQVIIEPYIQLVAPHALGGLGNLGLAIAPGVVGDGIDVQNVGV